MNKRLIVVLAGVLAVALAVAGCGGGDDDEATASSITKAQFIKQADAACEKSEKQIQIALGVVIKEKEDEGNSLQNPTEEEYAEIVEDVVTPNIETEIDEVRDLGAPSGDEEEVEALLDARQESLEIAEEEPELLFKESGKVFGASGKLAREYGLEVCSNY